jgi:hypothetical protein
LLRPYFFGKSYPGSEMAEARLWIFDTFERELIAAITGHRSLQEVRRYTRAANQLVLARRAMEAIPSPKPERKLATQSKRLAKPRSK